MTSLTDLLQTALHSQNAGKRRSASEQLARIGVPAVEPLIAAMQDTDVLVRRRAISLLRKIGDAKAVDTCIAALQDNDDQVRHEAAMALAKIPEPRAVQPLIAALKACHARHNTGDACKPYITALVAIGTPTVEPLIDLLTSDDKNLRMKAADALGKIADPQAVEPLIGMLNDNFFLTRSAAAEALGEIADLRAFEPLLPLLQDNTLTVISSAAWALARIDGSRALEPIIAMYKEDRDSFWCEWGQSLFDEALIEIGAPAVEPLMPLLKKGSDQMRYSAAWVLGETHDPRVVEPLITALRDPEARVRLQAVRSLCELMDPRAIQPLTASLQDPDKDVRWAAEEALEALSAATN